MKVAKSTVVTIDYTLTSDEGDVIDSSSGGEPLAYLHGFGNIVPGLENALDGHAEGDSVRVKVSPEEGYGEHDPELVHRASRAQFQGIAQVEVGMRFQAQSADDDESTVVTVVDVDGDTVTLDANHPLAGANLNFDVKIVGVRPATEAELEHGHPHGPDGHHHH